MAKLKRVVVSLTEEMLLDIEGLAADGRMCRSELIREACSIYIKERHRTALRERMKNGYIEMAELNRRLAEELSLPLDYTPLDEWRKD